MSLLAAYDAYVDTFRDAEGRLPEMMQLKRAHTARVVRNARLIAEGERLDPRTTSALDAAALLHDTGRYEQLKRYNTFRDADSVDHAVFSHAIVLEKGWLETEGGGTDADAATWRDAVLKAILYHNRRDLPDGLDPITFTVSHGVRDADKLDIFNVLEERVRNTDWRTDTRAFWNLSVAAAPNPAVVKAIAAREPVDYQNIKSLADFVLIQIGWMVSGLHFATSRQLCRARGHLEFRQGFLHELTDDPSVDRLCGLAAQALEG